jgi:hypothetical protein
LKISKPATNAIHETRGFQGNLGYITVKMSAKKHYLTFEEQSRLKKDILEANMSVLSLLNKYKISRATLFRYQAEVNRTSVAKPISFSTTYNCSAVISKNRKKIHVPKYYELEKSLLLVSNDGSSAETISSTREKFETNGSSGLLTAVNIFRTSC